jgi:hypothetical protein
MILWQLLCLFIDWQDWSRISSIGAVYFIFSDQDNVCCATCIWKLVIAATILGLSHQIIHSNKVLFQTGLVISALKFFILFEFLYKVMFDKFSDLMTCKIWIDLDIPPWPSKTPKTATPLSPTFKSEMWESSMDFLQPYIPQTP